MHLITEMEQWSEENFTELNRTIQQKKVFSY